jgi:putative ABC transport system substrate-binding protein
MSIRREFLLLLGGAMAVVRPLVAQQKAMPVIGFLHFASPGPFAPFVAAFHEGLREAGYVEGQNLAIEYRWAEGRYDRLPPLAADLVGRNVDVIVAAGPPSALAAKNATSTIPIVFSSADPIGEGLVTSLARPISNLTGVSILTFELMAKRLELLSELVPDTRVIALLVNPNNPNTEPMIRDVQDAARAKGMQLAVSKAGVEDEFEIAFASLAELQVGGLVVGTDPFFNSRRDELVALAARHVVPAIYEWREFAEAGGLDQLWNQPRRHISPGRHLCRKDPQRRQAGRSAGRATDQIRAGRQPENRQSARSDDPAHGVAARRRGHRMILWRAVGCRSSRLPPSCPDPRGNPLAAC